MAFPLSPSNGQQYTSGGFTYQYNSTLKTWTKIASTGSNIGNVSLANATVTTGNTTVSTTGLTTGTTSVSNTAVTVGNTTVTNTAVTVGNTSVTNTSVFIGNSTVNTSITSTGISTGNVTTTGISISGNIIPTANITYDLGTASNRWRDLYLSGNTIDLGGGTLEIVGNTFVITNPAGGTFTIDGNVSVSSQVLAQLDAGNLSQVNAIGILNLLNVTGNITTNSAINANQVYANSGSIGNLIVGGNITIGNVVGNISFKDGQVDLGIVTNVHIGGGSSGQYLKTDGAGNLSWSTVSGGGTGGATSPGGSNTQLQFNDSDSFAGDANLTYNKTTSTLTVSNVSISNNANISGNLGVTGNISGNNISITGSVSAANITATTFTGNLAGSSNTSITVSGNAQPNITSLGTLVNLSVSGNVLFSGANVSLGDVSNVHITGGSTGQILQTDGTGNLVWTAPSTGTGNANVAGSNTQIQYNDGTNLKASANLTFNDVTKTLTVDNISGNGSLLTGVVAAGGTATTVISSAQPNITSLGTLVNLSVSGNVLFSGADVTLGNISNLHITGGTSGYVLQTNGTGNLTWTPQPAPTSIFADSFSGNGVQVEFPLSSTPGNITQTSVNYNGVTIARSSYTMNGANIVFSSAPATGSTIEVTTLQTLGTMVNLSNVSIANLTTTGLATYQQTTDVVLTKTGATGVVAHDLLTGAIFYHSSIAGNFTVNLTNVPTTNNRTLVVVLVLEQGSTPYIPSALQIAGSAQTINWAGATVPLGNASKKDVVSFTLLRVGSAWTVLGSLGTYG